ncbi:TRAP transporter substrate-binding protein [Halomonas organivorans]|uniref:TRAP-type C4-dicarboxylate transport system substrate-binding protein n=1 Tax=Halomonas organivorans TaxID=257772 RepID=A0A7W5BV21_9GAMM|nr:TRAP transporter substrate-binding protein [Halomonas organivorans]MBB3139604.1 TRAP-type C4-dicarboxylate transport system substrate-binding protein [Halomonas organivorans]
MKTIIQATNNRARLFASFMGLGALLTGQGVVQAQESVVLNYAFFAPAQSFPAVQMKHWAEEVEDRTDGLVSVNLFPGGTLLTANNMYDGVLSGVADIGLSATSYEPGRFPLLNLAGTLPGQEVNSEVASQMTFQLIQEFEEHMPAFDDLKVIAAFTSEPAYLQTLDPIRNLEDLEELEIRISGDNSIALEALGATAIGMSQTDAGEALQSGIIDGYAASREVLMDLKFARMAKYVTDYPLTNTLFVAAMSRDRWDSLPDDVRRVINDLAPEMSAFTGRYLDDHIQNSLEWAQDTQGVEIVSLSEAERERWNDRLSPVSETLLDNVEGQGLPAREFAQRMRELTEKYRTP